MGFSKASGKKKKKSKALFLKEKNTGSKFINYILLVGIALFLGIFFMVISSLRVQKAELDAKLDDIKLATDAEKVRTAQLDEQKVYTHTKEFIEEQARETYGLLYDGEILFVCGEE
ncbi:MAG: septum formation initiator family protein [Lachnospiraceae bacterium]|nr:septum formation initiator family protein [Lachnospiraceae bacterium]